MNVDNKHGVLIGNSFPLSLIRRRVVIEPNTIENLKTAIKGERWQSFWGHENTLEKASALVGVDLTPAEKRPALVLDREQFPSIDGISVRVCWILSPDYIPGFRPDLNLSVPEEKIIGWQVLKITWK